MQLILHGAAYSAYTRIVRIVLEEKSISCAFREIDFISDGMPAGHPHPFRKVPVLETDGAFLFEALPICLYLEESRPVPSLMPESPLGRASVLQLISSLDSYIWPDIRELVTQRVFAPLAGGQADDSVTRRMEKRLQRSLAAFAGQLGEGRWLQADRFSLADCYAAPMFDYLAMTVEGQALIAETPRLADWWQAIQARGSLAATAFSLRDYPFARKAEG